MTFQTEKQRLALHATILERLSDVLPGDPLELGLALGSLSMTLIAKAHPGRLDAAAKQLIKENYPDATPALMKERALDEEGLETALALYRLLAVMALDYSPLGHVKPLIDQDTALGPDVSASATRLMADAFKKAQALGVSTFGAATTMILFATLEARRQGVSTYQIARPLLDGVSFALESPRPHRSDKEFEEVALKALCAQMGISKTEAKRYLAEAKRMQAGE